MVAVYVSTQGPPENTQRRGALELVVARCLSLLRLPPNPNPSMNWNPSIDPNLWIPNDDTLSDPGAANANSLDMNDFPVKYRPSKPFPPWTVLQ
ncbi:hypothetical protein GJ744_010649 [Endocarpon pusillum]|uniref:Uncharacterized protein n=1 Tax=Endocarpon pusillum TaxID=364733 RepID=A0A8H7E9J0_9EURO|nr:hypothetical protein GJ744_010649 [Endocarpon pusillum]